ncbi:inovirus Gp2 family protein [Acinetobacter bereziniae]|uniref:inovirus Gp2 family protein n=1 Tax=Acinetobacter bereziniae TaxID=106648 RepID=UPI0021D35E03|nr:inovirus Gp2 family protein [Acinetobacter bereziniae]MCU4316384.1 inovirus Gp2 family protein [Acinetobacter bereziniae]
MENQINIDDSYPPNSTELITVQENDRIYPIDNPEIETTLRSISIVKHIQEQSSQQLCKLDCDGNSLCTYDPNLAFLIRGIRSIPNDDSNYHCEHLEVFNQAYKHSIAPYIHPDDQYFFWRAQPNQIFQTYDDENEKILSSNTAAKLLNDLVYTINLLINKPRFKAALYARSERSKRQYKRARKLVQSLRNKFSKLLVIRIDFCWKGSIEDDSTSNVMKPNFAQLLKGFHHSKDLPNIVGYLWKLEFGEKKGYHYHCIFFMDGNKFQSDTHYAEIIGQRWTEITLGKGYYFNCHRDKIKYRHLAIGMARHSDQTFFDNLDQVLVYICKQDQFLIDKRLLGKVHTFGTSKCTKQPKTVGRPRLFSITPNPIPQGKSTTSVIVVKKKQPLKPTGDLL